MGELLGGAIVDGEFDEFDAEAFRSRRHRRNVCSFAGPFPRNWSIR